MSSHDRRSSREPDAVPIDTDESISKSERKRRAHRLQALGRALTELKPEELAELHLPAGLHTAIADYQRFPSHEARRRQLQFIGRLMRDVDPEPLQEALDALEGQSAQARYEHHQIEHWRDRLLAEPEALTEFLNEFPGVNSQQLRHHVSQVKGARTSDQKKIAYRALFRFLRDETHPA